MGVREVYHSSGLIKKNGFVLGIQTMVDYPKILLKSFIYRQKVVEISPDLVRIYPVLVIRDTYLEKMYYSGEYAPLELNETVDLCSKLVKIYRENNINVIRIGLQTTENINKDGDVIAGPFHPALRQLVESKIALDAIEKEIQRKNLKEKDVIIISTSKEKISDVIGQKNRILCI